MGLEPGWEMRGSPFMLPSLCPGTRLLHQEGAAVFHPVPQLGWADGERSPSPRGDSWGTGAPMDPSWIPEPRQQNAPQEPGVG